MDGTGTSLGLMSAEQSQRQAAEEQIKALEVTHI
jgi:hypothetical protein